MLCDQMNHYLKRGVYPPPMKTLPNAYKNCKDKFYMVEVLQLFQCIKMVKFYFVDQFGQQGRGGNEPEVTRTLGKYDVQPFTKGRGSRQMGGRQMSGRQMGGRQMGGRQMGGRQMGQSRRRFRRDVFLAHQGGPNSEFIVLGDEYVLETIKA